MSKVLHTWTGFVATISSSFHPSFFSKGNFPILSIEIILGYSALVGGEHQLRAMHWIQLVVEEVGATCLLSRTMSRWRGFSFKVRSTLATAVSRVAAQSSDNCGNSAHFSLFSSLPPTLLSVAPQFRCRSNGSWSY